MELTLSSLPARIQRLHELAYNLWWSWRKEADALVFRNRPDPVGHYST